MAGVGAKTKKKPPAKPTKPARAPAGRGAAKPAPAARTKSKPAPAPKKAAAPARVAPKPEAPPPPPPPGSPLAAPRAVPPVPARGQVAPSARRPLEKGDFALDKLLQVSLTATNLDVAVAFYRDVLGLKFIARFDPPGVAYFHLAGGTRLQLSATASQASLYFTVEGIDQAVAALKARGVNFLHPPMMFHRDINGELGKKGVEEWVAFFRDPSGNTLALVERR